MNLFAGITIEDTRECLLAALRRLRDPDAAKDFEQNFQSLERLWEAIARAQRELRALERELAGLLALAGRRPGDGSDQPALFRREAQPDLF